VEPSLREPVLYPNWVWLLGVALVLVALIWLVGMIVGYRKSAVKVEADLRSLSAARRERYERHISQVEAEFANGTLTPRESHLAMAAIIRAAATERSGYNVETLTVDEAPIFQSNWPELGYAIGWCEEPSFSADEATKHISSGAQWARVIVG